jgi:hypothetical protein
MIAKVMAGLLTSHLANNKNSQKIPLNGVVPVRIQRQFYLPDGELDCYAVIFGLKPK